MQQFLKISRDPRSGRPIPPLWWQLAAFFTLAAMVLVATMIVCASLAVRQGRLDMVAGSLFSAAIFALLAVIQIVIGRRQKRQFQQLMTEFEQIYDDI